MTLLSQSLHGDLINNTMEISFTETWRSLGYHGDKVHRIVMDLWASKEIDTGVGGRLRVPSRLALSAATTRAQIRAMDPAMRRDLFAEYITLQKHSKNLVFFDREFDEAREFPYPMSQGRVIYPEGIPAYLNMRRIKFECFCALLSPVLLFVEVKTIAGRTRASCSDCGLNVSIDEKYVSANLAADYPTQDKDGAVSPVSSTPYRRIPPRAPLHRRVLITTRKRSSLAYAASHPVVAAIALVPPGIQAASRSRLQRATGTHAVTQQHESLAQVIVVAQLPLSTGRVVIVYLPPAAWTPIEMEALIYLNFVMNVLLISLPRHSRLTLQTVAAINYSNLRSRRPEIGWWPYSGVKSTSFDFTLDAIRSGRTYANGNNRPITQVQQGAAK
ncbi:hypothetical protein BU17DRAFT_64057 [Hysterangium stoloniferum]|nr:hypothetical protein BU17DRAFT_64057 [Hysterangium stoloniferum]